MVTGYRASLQRAMDIKRNSNSIVDAISAEDIGKFPDRNAAESLAHLPGISVDRLYGEGEKVSINGTDPQLNRVLVNGQTIATGDWGGSPGDTQGGRTFNYTLLAPEIIGLMEVGLVAAVLYHALNGIRVILIDFWQHGPRYQRLMLWGVAAVWLAVMIPALGVLGMHMAERFL
jgi:hypothetical protein